MPKIGHSGFGESECLEFLLIMRSSELPSIRIFWLLVHSAQRKSIYIFFGKSTRNPLFCGLSCLWEKGGWIYGFVVRNWNHVRLEIGQRF